ncbi:universal stress protein [Thiohalorhabdus sp. Cl-TMA]|uniref:Universal stress protein n=1 Tax=Thiohalorhabdus methylotrophus TaxID=3242694 RepID=A0ABV4TVH5_9GAMM
MYKVLVPIDHDKGRASAQAQAIIDLPDGQKEVQAILFHVFGDNPEGASVAQVASVHTVMDALKKAGIAYDLQEASGDPATAVLDACRSQEVNLICMSGRKRNQLDEMLFGSVAHEVVHRSDIPVMVCGPTT